MAEEEEIEGLRRRKMLELRANMEEQQRQAEQRRQFETQKKMAILPSCFHLYLDIKSWVNIFP